MLLGVAVRTVSRAASQILGANGRDDGAKVSMCPLFIVLTLFKK